MYWLRTSIPLPLALLSTILLASPVWAIEGFIIGIGAESDTADGLSGVVAAEVGFTEQTWLSASFAKNTVDLQRDFNLDTSYADIGLDHWFKPVGVRVGVASWGDDNILDSVDFSGSLYWRNDTVTVSGDYEFRDFDVNIPQTLFLPARSINFDATGVGLSARFKLNEMFSLSLSGIDYDYDVNLRISDNAGIVELLSSSRLSIINSLIDSRAGARLGLDIGNQHWSLDYSQREGAVDGTTTKSTTLSFLTPMGDVSDIEIGIGFDDSDTYGSVTFISVFLYFYGGG